MDEMLAKPPPRDEESSSAGPPVSGLALQLGASPPTSPAPKRASAVRGPGANGEDFPVRIVLSFFLFFAPFFFISIKKLFIPTPGTVGQHDASVRAKQPETQGSRGVGRGGSNETRALRRNITRRGTAHGKWPPCLSFFFSVGDGVADTLIRQLFIRSLIHFFIRDERRA